MNIDKRDFKTWLSGEPGWKEIAYLYNTGQDYQDKQSLSAVFWNHYVYYQQKFEMYFQEFGIIPHDVFNDLIFKFRQLFPKTGRVEGVNYFDDLIEQLIEKYSAKPHNRQGEKLLTLSQIALICYYNNWSLSEEDLQRKAIEYRGTINVSKSTGEQLRKKLNYYFRELNRIYGRTSVDDILTTLPYLQDKPKEKAEAELIKARENKKG
jgi:hypothetical protein